MTMTIRQVLEAAPKTVYGRATLFEAVTDDSGQMTAIADTPIESPSIEEADPKEQIRQGMLAAINKSLSEADTVALRAVLKALNLSDSVSETVSGKVADPDAEPMPEEQLVEEVAKTEEEEPIVPAAPAAPNPDDEEDEMRAAESQSPVFQAMAILESAGAPLKRRFVEAVAAIKGNRAKQDLAAELAATVMESAVPAPMRTPRSGSGGSGRAVESAAKKFEKPGSLADFCAAPPRR
jgi:hypothetical protein